MMTSSAREGSAGGEQVGYGREEKGREERWKRPQHVGAHRHTHTLSLSHSLTLSLSHSLTPTHTSLTHRRGHEHKQDREVMMIHGGGEVLAIRQKQGRA